MTGCSVKKYTKKFVLVISVFICASCADLKIDLQIRENNSGTIDLDYKIPWLVENIRDYKNNSIIFLPASTEDITAIVRNNPDLRLISMSRDDNPSDYRIQASISFGNIESIKTIFKLSDEDLLINSARRNSRLEIQLHKKNPDVDQETVNIIKTAFPDYKIEINVQSVNKIDNTLNISLSNNDRNATFSAGLADIISADKDLRIGFSW